jgi:hypothetical protein
LLFNIKYGQRENKSLWIKASDVVDAVDYAISTPQTVVISEILIINIESGVTL